MLFINKLIIDFIHAVFESYSYFIVYLLTWFYFMCLYFILGPLFLYTCQALEKRKLLNKIIEQAKFNTVFEIKNSLFSIIVFGFSGIMMAYLIRNHYVLLLPDNLLNTFVGLFILTAWNELHFFVVHRIMHVPYFYKHIHKIHHQSKTPSVFSVYSFHWLEALLLSTVPITIAPFIHFSALAIFLYPLTSILINFTGHCNYRFGNGHGFSWKLFATRHSQHHYRNNGNYGFVTNLFDYLTTSTKKKK